MELVRAASLTRYFEVAEELCLATVPLLREAGLTRAMKLTATRTVTPAVLAACWNRLERTSCISQA